MSHARRAATNWIRWGGYAALVAILVAMYLPVLMIVVYSFNKSRIGTVWTGFSTHWYGELFRRTDLWDGLWMSLMVGVGSATLSVMLGGVAAWRLKESRGGLWQLATRSLLYLPLVLPDVTLGMSMALFFYFAGVPQGAVTIVLAQSVCGMCYAYVVVSAALQRFDRTLIDAALDCGATFWQAHRYVTLPLLGPSLATAWIFAFVVSFDDFLIAFFTKGVGADTLPIKVYALMRFGLRPDTNALFSLLFVLALLGLLFVHFVNRAEHASADLKASR